MNPKTRTRRHHVPGGLLVLALLALAAAAGADDEVPVPGGQACLRRLFRLDPEGPARTFFAEFNEVLLFGYPADADWSAIETRRKTMDFVQDLSQWRRSFGDSAAFSTASAGDRSRCERALEWLGFRVRWDSASLEVERRVDETSVRRQAFLDVLGTPTAAFLGELRAGRAVTIAAGDGTAPLPFGLDGWRETIPESGLTAANAFLFFVRNVRASRMLVALESVDPETREGLRGAIRDAKGRPAGWRFLYEQALDPFTRFPEALQVQGGRFRLPGGAEADPIWTSLFGASPSEPAAFLRSFYAADRSKAAYVVDVLQHLAEERAREWIFGAGAPGPDAVSRFRRLYASIEPAGGNHELPHRDPYDFAQLAPQLPPGESLLQAFRQDSIGKPERFRAQRRALFLSSLVAESPALADPGLATLLDRSLDRFSEALEVLADFGVSRPELAKRYLSTLDRLDLTHASRADELRAGLFQADLELLDRMARAGSLGGAEAESLLVSLLDVPCFAREDVSPGQGESALFAWLSQKLLPAVRAGLEGSIAGSADSSGETPEGPGPDEVMEQALTGAPHPVPLEWRGGRYRFDPVRDETSRRRAFREKQNLARIADLEALHRSREAVVSAAAAGNLDAVKAAAAELGDGLGLAAEKASPSDEERDERIDREQERGREAAAAIAALPAKKIAEVPERLAALDTVLAERHLEALLGHVYSASAGDPDDLSYQDPFFVRRHSFRAVELGGQAVRTAFSTTALVSDDRSGGSRIAGSLFGLSEVLGLLHADQLAYPPGARVSSEPIRSGLVVPIRQMNVALLDDDSLEVVAASCQATRKFAATLGASAPGDRLSAWETIARDLVPRARLALLASLDGAPSEQALDRYLSPSDLYRIGRRMAERKADGKEPPLPDAERARDAMDRLVRNHGESGAKRRLAEFGPRPAAYSGRRRLADVDLPPYERLAAYRRAEILGDRLYDLKISVACRIEEARLPAAVLSIVLPAALDAMLVRLTMAHPYDWKATTRAASAFSRADLDRILDEAVRTGRLVREEGGPA